MKILNVLLLEGFLCSDRFIQSVLSDLYILVKRKKKEDLDFLLFFSKMAIKKCVKHVYFFIPP